MKLTKAALILLMFTILIFNAFALTEWEGVSAVALPDVSTANLAYECRLCVKEQEMGSNQSGWARVYACNEKEQNCELTVSQKEGDLAKIIAKLKFSNARVSFINDKLQDIQAIGANKNGLPYNINGFLVPYVASYDKIDFAHASTGMNIHTLPNLRNLVINGDYFKHFYYDIGDFNSVGDASVRNPYLVESQMDTETGYILQRGYWRPISLCGQEFFDAVTEDKSLTVDNRQLTVNGRSWFLVGLDNQDKCKIKNYQLNARLDETYSNNVQVYAREYNCGYSNYIVHSAAATNLECRPAGINEAGDLLRCPVAMGPDKIACQEKTRISMQVGRTIYNLRSDTISLEVEDTDLEISGHEIPTTVKLNAKVEDVANSLGAPLISVKGSESLVVVTVLPSTCEESGQGCYKLKIDSGIKVGLSNNDVSFVEIGPSEAVVEIWDYNTRTLQRRYVLNNQKKDANYRLAFDNNELMEISNLNKPSLSGTRIEGHLIKGIRIVYPMASLNGRPGAALQLNEHVELYPLEEGQDEASVNRPFLKYIVKQGGERLNDIAARFYGISTLDDLERTVPNNPENSQLKSLIADYARNIKFFNSRRNNLAGWVQSTELNPALFGGEEVYIPLSATTFLHPTRNNHVTIYSNSVQAYDRLFERQSQGQQLIFRDIGSIQRSIQVNARNNPEVQTTGSQLQLREGEQTVFRDIGSSITGQQIRNIQQTTATTNCLDLDDGGDNPEIRGLTSMTYIINGRTLPNAIVLPDTCIGNSILAEYFCRNNKIASRQVLCSLYPYSLCSAGTCRRVQEKGGTTRTRNADLDVLGGLEPSDQIVNSLARTRCVNHRVCKTIKRDSFCSRGLCRPFGWDDPIYGIQAE